MVTISFPTLFSTRFQFTFDIYLQQIFKKIKLISTFFGTPFIFKRILKSNKNKKKMYQDALNKYQTKFYIRVIYIQILI